MSKLIYVDPGHGGIDPGAVANGRQEKDYNLQVTTIFAGALKRCGLDVRMTRTIDALPSGGSDISADLDYRAHIANAAGADLFVAWHADSASDPSVSGLAVWIHPNAKGTRTETWAQSVGAAISAATGQPFRGVCLGDFAVLRETAMDAMLIEGDFITNQMASQKLFDASFQQKQAEAAARAVCGIFGVAYVAPPVQKSALTVVSDAADKVIAALGAVWNASGDPDVQAALHYGAAILRVAAGEATGTPSADGFTADGGEKAAKLLGAVYTSTQNSDVQFACHYAASAIRSAKGIAG